MSVLLLILGLILFSLLVVVHEYGHYIVAKRNGVIVEEFAIFFGPSLYKSTTKSKMIFSIRAFPFGGFVRLKGEHDSDTEKGTYGAATTWVKTKIMAAGVVMNLITALVLFAIIALLGMPKLVDNQYTIKSDTKPVTQEVLITYVEPDSPAERAGLQPQDLITDISRDGYSPVSVENAKKLPTVTKSFAGMPVTVYYIRAGHHHEAHLTLRSTAEVVASQKTDSPKGYLGISPLDFQLQRSTWSAPIVAVGLSSQLTVLTFQGLGHAIGGVGSIVAGAATGNTQARQNGQASAGVVSGPVGIFEILKSGSNFGLQFMLFIIALISLTLAIFNILPIPALDGGRLWLMLASRAVKKPLSADLEERINAIGFIALMSLILLISVVDVKRYFF